MWKGKRYNRVPFVLIADRGGCLFLTINFMHAISFIEFVQLIRVHSPYFWKFSRSTAGDDKTDDRFSDSGE